MSHTSGGEGSARWLQGHVVDWERGVVSRTSLLFEKSRHLTAFTDRIELVGLIGQRLL